MSETPSVLFVCVHNAGRSQMAAALTEMHSQGQIAVFSAGSEPADEINPMAVEVMAELGIDIRSRTPRLLEDGAVRAADVVVTMGCGDACPVYPGTRYLDWDLPDPAGQDLDTVRSIRDAINIQVLDLVFYLLNDGSNPKRSATLHPD